MNLDVLRDLFHNFKFKTKFLAAKDVRKIELPKLSRKAECRPMLVQVGNEFQPQKAPEVGQTYISANRPKFDLRVERKGCAIGHETGKRIAVEMIPMSRVGGPIGIRVVRSDDFDQTRRFSDSVEFANKGHYVRHVFDNMPADDYVEFVVRKRIRKSSEVVNDVRIGPGI